MTVFYIDPENGDNSKDGQSFANRWKSFGPSVNFPSVIGDEYRIIASPQPVLLGNGTWEDNKDFVITPTVLTKLLDAGETLYTTQVSNNLGKWIVVVDKDGPSPTNPGVILTVPDALIAARHLFTYISTGQGSATGVVAWRDLGVVTDLSAFTHLSFLYTEQNNSQPMPSITLNLCSDTAGLVPVRSFTFTPTRGRKQGILFGDGTPLPANVRSLSWSIPTAPQGNYSWSFQNLFACYAPSDVRHISHKTIISRQTENEPEWLPIRGIVNDKIYIGGIRHSNGEDLTFRNWRGPTGSAALWAMQTLQFKGINKYDSQLATDANVITVSGGWDRAAMDTQSGVSWIDGQDALPTYDGEYPQQLNASLNGVGTLFLSRRAAFFNGTTGSVEVRVSKIGFANFEVFPIAMTDFDRMLLDLEGIAGISDGLKTYGPNSVLNFKDVTYCQKGPVGPVSQSINGRGVTNRGELLIKCRKVFNTSLLNYFPPQGLGFEVINAVDQIIACNVGVANLFVAGTNPISDGSPYSDYRPGITKLYNTKFSLNSGDAQIARDLWLVNPTFTAEPSIYWYADNFQSILEPCVRMDGVNGNPWDSRVYHYLKNRVSRVDNTVFRVPGKRSLRLDASDQFADYVKFPYREQVALVPARAGEEVTVSAQVRFNNTAATEKQVSICTVEGITPGVGTILASTVRDMNQWCRVVLKFTSTIDALVPIFLECRGGTVWASEVGLDSSGIPPDVPIVPVAVDKLTFKGVDETILATYPGVVAGTADAQACVTASGITVTKMLDGQLLFQEGSAIGVLGLDFGASAQGILVLSPGWENFGTGGAMKVHVIDNNGVLLEIQDGFQGAGSGDYTAYATVSFSMTTKFVAGTQYTLEVFR
jgi:hypothetical protein